MCQCTLCNCWWCNFCGVQAGCSQSYCCLGFWCCAPASFPPEGKDCCQCCKCVGYGGNCFCLGGTCCAPQWLAKWSQAQK